jgi:hypothetical protein
MNYVASTADSGSRSLRGEGRPYTLTMLYWKCAKAMYFAGVTLGGAASRSSVPGRTP